MKMIQDSYNFHFLSEIPKRNEIKKDGDAHVNHLFSVTDVYYHCLDHESIQWKEF